MVSPGDKFREVWTSAFYNQLQSLLGRGNKVTGSGGIQVAAGKDGIQIAAPPQVRAISTLQGTIIGGDAPACTDGTTVLDMFAWNAYSIQGGAFITAAGTTTVSVQVNGVAVTWLDGLVIDSTGLVVPLPNPILDRSNVVPPGAQLTIVTSSSSGDCAGLQFTLNVPY